MEKEGILLIDKPRGITSYDVIRLLQKKMGKIKMGHAGTLDPRASGLMIVGLGKATKELARLIKLSKTYEAEALLGLATDTGDLDGKVLEVRDVALEESSLREAVSKLVGTVELPVPLYSAIKQGGTPLYKKARRGEKVDVPRKTMKVNRAALISITVEKECQLGSEEVVAGNFVVLKIIFDVESGTYIRSLAEEIGRTLGVPATLKELRRTRVGDFHIEQAQKLANPTFQLINRVLSK